jgi:hypothetical protein
MMAIFIYGPVSAYRLDAVYSNLLFEGQEKKRLQLSSTGDNS